MPTCRSEAKPLWYGGTSYSYYYGPYGFQFVGDDETNIEFHIGKPDWGKGASSGTGVIQNNVWYHLVGTYDGSRVRIYVNGSKTDGDTTSGDITTYDGENGRGSRVHGWKQCPRSRGPKSNGWFFWYHPS